MWVILKLLARNKWGGSYAVRKWGRAASRALVVALGASSWWMEEGSQWGSAWVCVVFLSRLSLAHAWSARVHVFCCYCCWCCSDERESLRCDSAAFLWAASRSPNPVFIRIHKAVELLLLLCAAAKSAWEALMRARPAQECRLKVSRHKHCSGWGGATSKKSAKPQSAGPVFSLYLPSFFFSFFFLFRLSFPDFSSAEYFF